MEQEKVKVLVTGAKGFVGKNLVAELINRKTFEIYQCDIDTSEEDLEEFCRHCDFVFHLAGINRPQNVSEFAKGNIDATAKLLELLKKHHNKAPIVVTSSIQAKLDNDYGKSKRAGEMLAEEYAQQNGVNVFIFRFPNLFGKWCRPNYNSVVATFCYNIARGIPISISNPSAEITFAYIDDVVKSLIDCINNIALLDEDGFCKVQIENKTTIGKLAEVLQKFKMSRETLSVADMNNDLEKKLYSTYTSYLDEKDFSNTLNMHIDNRGSFTEIFKTNGQGQISVNISKPHIVKGNHWHNSKNEKFIVVHGYGVIRFRKIGSQEVIEYHVSGNKLEVVDIPVGYVHNIENLGEEDMVTIMWVNELFDPLKPDTYPETV